MARSYESNGTGFNVRAFIAVDLTKEIQSRIAEIQSVLQKFSPAVRWVRPQSIHLTLKFLGEINSSWQEQIVDLFSSQRCPVSPFQISVAQMGFFPSAQAPRVIWLGIDQGKAPLQSLAKYVDKILCGVGFTPEPREFSPHVTIGRTKFLRDPQALIDAVWRFGQCGCGTAWVRQFFLYESQLDRKGSVYTKRAIFGLE